MLQTPHSNGTGVENYRPTRRAIVDAIVRTVAYVDVFDYPLTAEEVHRYLVGIAAPQERVYRILWDETVGCGHLAEHDGFFTLPGREELVCIRRRRQEAASQMWPEAIRYGRQIGALPFVKMVAVTGSLAVDNVMSDADIDYLLVTEPGRLWLARAFTILIVRIAARRGINLCPNYFLSENALVFSKRNLYTAHELVQMVPLCGQDMYERMRTMNAWTVTFLPNAKKSPRQVTNNLSSPLPWLSGMLAEKVLRSTLGTRLERWEMNRKIAKFSRDNRADEVEAAFCPDWCKGHFDGHGHRIMAAYEDRVIEFESKRQ